MLILLLLLLFPAAGWAQFPIGSGSPIMVTDIAAEQSLAAIDGSVTQMLTQETAIRLSLTVGLPNPAFTPGRMDLTSLFGTLNGDTFSNYFPGWVPKPDNATEQSKIIVRDTLDFYRRALATAQSLSATDPSNMSGIGQVVSGNPTLLAVEQAQVYATLALVQEMQLERQAIAVVAAENAIRYAEEMNTRAQEQASSVTSWSLPGGQ